MYNAMQMQYKRKNNAMFQVNFRQVYTDKYTPDSFNWEFKSLLFHSYNQSVNWLEADRSKKHAVLTVWQWFCVNCFTGRLWWLVSWNISLQKDWHFFHF